MSFLKGNMGGILGTLSPALGAITGKGLGADLLPMLSPAAALFGLGGHNGGSDGKAEAGPAAPAAPTGPDFAQRFGTGMNQIAAAGGAAPGYQQNPGFREPPPIQNYLQMLDPRVLQALIQHFGGQR